MVLPPLQKCPLCLLVSSTLNDVFCNVNALLVDNGCSASSALIRGIEDAADVHGEFHSARAPYRRLLHPSAGAGFHEVADAILHLSATNPGRDVAQLPQQRPEEFNT